MSWHRIRAIIMRHLVQLPQDVNQWASILFWPLLNILLFGTTGSWLHEPSSNALFALVSGVALWQLVVRTNFGVSLSLLQEILSHNVTNLFSSPLSIAEWICAIIIYGAIFGTVTMLFCVGVVWYLFGFNMLNLGLYLIYTTIQLLIAGTGIGFLGASLLMLWGTRVQTLIFIVGVGTAPLSGAFYPIHMLPPTLQKIAYCLPFSHIFSGLFTYIQEDVWSWYNIAYATMTNATIFIISIICFVTSFMISKDTGFKYTEE